MKVSNLLKYFFTKSNRKFTGLTLSVYIWSFLRLFAFFALFFISVNGMAQNATPTFDKITLRTGEVYVGEIVAQTADFVTIKLKNGGRYQFQLSEVANIAKAEEHSLPGQTEKKDAAVSRSVICAQFDVCAGLAGAKYVFDTSIDMSSSLTFGIQNASKAITFSGLGVAVRRITTDERAINILPLYCRFLSSQSGKGTSPLFGFDAGYGLSLTPEIIGGPFCNASLGMIHRLSYKSSFILSGYFGLQSISSELSEFRDSGLYQYKGHTSIYSYGLKLGFRF